MPYMLNITKMDTVITKTDSQRIWRNILVILSIHCIKYYQNRTTFISWHNWHNWRPNRKNVNKFEKI